MQQNLVHSFGDLPVMNSRALREIVRWSETALARNSTRPRPTLQLLSGARPLSFSPQLRTKKTTKYFGHYGPPIHIHNLNEARVLVHFLGATERAHLTKALEETGRSVQAAGGGPMTREQSRALFLINVLPFVGFGFLDNMIMILAGEWIDVTIGVTIGLSTMAAAGLGNIISDIAGIGAGHYVEFLVAKFGVLAPSLTTEQWNSSRARWIANVSRCFGLVIGCIIGMFPLLFFDEKVKEAADSQKEPAD